MHRNLHLEKRAAAAALRKRAKAPSLKADAIALRKQAKSISEEAGKAGAVAAKTLKELFQKALEAQQALVARIPPEWQDWDVAKTRAYTNTLTILSTQLTRKNPKPDVVASAIQHLLSHSSWQERTLQILPCATPSAKTLPFI